MTSRSVELLELPTGPALLDLLPRLADALAGHGPALAPVAAGDRARIAELHAAFRTGTPLTDGEDDPDDPTALVVATSGSTGTPKGTLLTRSALTASAAATAARLGAAGTWLLALPAQHIAGLQVLLRSLATGSRPHVLDTGLPFTPERFARASAALPDGPRFVSLVPTQLHRLLADAAATDALRTFAAVLVGGSATPPPLVERARAAEIALLTTYGMSETCGGCVYDGVPLDGVRVELDPEGRVRLRGAMVGRGYRGLPGHPAFAERGVFRTDDLGTWSGGRLRILGRTDDMVISGGVKVAPAVLENAVLALPEVAEVLVVGVDDPEWGQRLVAVLTLAPGSAAPDSHRVRAACRAAGVPAALAPRQVLVVPELPSRGPGKPDRAAAAELARAVDSSSTRPVDGLSSQAIDAVSSRAVDAVSSQTVDAVSSQAVDTVSDRVVDAASSQVVDAASAQPAGQPVRPH